MNFFAQQAKARSNTGKLVLLFALAIASLILLTLLFLVFVMAFYTRHSLHYELLDAKLVTDISIVIIAIIVLAWGYKSMQLASGGRAVAESMDGSLINHNTDDIHEKKILNVVEEMAIASGIPVPPVYVFEESGINAFAAGYAVKDAVIAISRGCITNLNRDELQGVIAHEFSHIFNGDMRLNIRLISTLYGILVIGLIGEILMRNTSGFNNRSSNNSRDIDGLFITGLGLMVIGYAGTFFGQLIKAAVSRQREFLADASAVQFTRQADGIANALKKIGGYPLGSYMEDPQAHEISHLFFNQAVHIRFAGWMATHPPLPERIRRVDPHWDGTYIKVEVPEDEKINPGLLHPGRNGMPINPAARKQPVPAENLSAIEFFSAAAAPVAMSAIEQVGSVTPQHVIEAQTILQNIPEQLKKLARDACDVQAIIYCLLLDKQRSNIREQQLQYLQARLQGAIYGEVLRVKELVSTLLPRQRLPLLNVAVNTLRQLSKAQYAEFKLHMMALIHADNAVDLLEWSLYRMIEHFLESPPSQRIGSLSLPNLQKECQRLLSAIALTNVNSAGDAEQCFQKAWAMLGLPAAPLITEALAQIPLLDQSLIRLNQLHPLKKPLFIKACCAALPGEDDPEGIEIIFTIVNSLDVPMPPLLANQKIC
jgi:Zn-dependent protease with chaperone function